MRYPTLFWSETDELATRLVQGEAPAIDAAIIWVGSGDDVDLSALDGTIEDLRSRYAEFVGTGQRPEVFEGRAAGDLHAALRDLPIETLDAPGFWRYVAVAKLWWFIAVRESGPIARGNHMTYIDGRRPTECVPLRMFLRAQAIRDGDDYSLAHSMPQAADFWRSHIIRVQTGTAPAFARSFARFQAHTRMPSDELRPFARRVNRLWSNVVLHLVDEDEATELMTELYESDDTSTTDEAADS